LNLFVRVFPSRLVSSRAAADAKLESKSVFSLGFNIAIKPSLPEKLLVPGGRFVGSTWLFVG
jgi:hypothetical protein